MLLCIGHLLVAQSAKPVIHSSWEHNVTFNNYFFSDAYIFLPTYEAEKGHLHLGARYNYEDLRTFSGWVGYNLMGGDELQYKITPMAGVIVGQTDGYAGGLLIGLDYGRFSFYTEAEYVSDINDHSNDFLYSWTDVTYTILDALWIGLSFQRTRLYQTDLDVQRGVLIGTAFFDLELTGYLYNLGVDHPFVILALSKDF